MKFMLCLLSAAAVAGLPADSPWPPWVQAFDAPNYQGEDLWFLADGKCRTLSKGQRIYSVGMNEDYNIRCRLYANNNCFGYVGREIWDYAPRNEADLRSIYCDIPDPQ